MTAHDSPTGEVLRQIRASKFGQEERGGLVEKIVEIIVDRVFQLLYMIVEIVDV